MLDNQLLCGNDKLKLAEIQAPVQHHQHSHASQYQEWHLEGDGIMSSHEEQHKTHEEHESL